MLAVDSNMLTVDIYVLANGHCDLIFNAGSFLTLCFMRNLKNLLIKYQGQINNIIFLRARDI